ncbi:MAG: hypothetical protein EKK46_01775 [Rhodocyclaceae bacterium]|nr:MAG: hypothetical protein EKK46_01775 [Rhodocyclaceae bacterium]
MMSLWQRYVDWFSGLAVRERNIIAIALVGGTLMLGIGQWVEPMFTQSRKMAAQASQDRIAAQGLIGQVAGLELQAANPNTSTRAAIEQAQRTLLQQEPRIRDIQQSFVPAASMPIFLDNLLSGNRTLQVVSLETLPPEGITTGDGKSPPKLFKHGLRITLAGSYQDLVAYLDALEKAPQKVLWGDMVLSVTAYPKVDLTLTLYTLSQDKTWLTL